MALIGWLACLIPLTWISGLCFFATIPTFGEAAFSGKWYAKAMGVCGWIFVAFCWYQWLSVITVNV
jgi:hypothetical protein